MPTDFIGLFAVLAAARIRFVLVGGQEVRVASIEDWIRMKTFVPNEEPSAWGTYEDAEALRRCSFERRTPEQRLAWLKAALELAYQSGAIKPRRPDPSSPES